MYDINGNYIAGFGIPYRIKSFKKKSKQKDTKVESEEKYEFVYLPDEYLPAYEIRKIIYTTKNRKGKL